MRFNTKVDAWIKWVLIASIAFPVVLMLMLGDWVGLLVAVLIIGLAIKIVWPCYYNLENENLIIKSGVIKWTVPYSKIFRVQQTRNPLSSPALSLDRLMIHYGKIWVMISPENKEEFLQELRKRTGLVERGEELVMPD